MRTVKLPRHESESLRKRPIPIQRFNIIERSRVRSSAETVKEKSCLTIAAGLRLRVHRRGRARTAGEKYTNRTSGQDLSHWPANTEKERYLTYSRAARSKSRCCVKRARLSYAHGVVETTRPAEAEATTNSTHSPARCSLIEWRGARRDSRGSTRHPRAGEYPRHAIDQALRRPSDVLATS